MSRFVSSRIAGSQARPSGHAASALLMLVSTATLAGCSADLGRFEFPTASPSGRHASAPIPTEPVRGHAGLGLQSAPDAGYPTSQRSVAVDLEPLPGVAPPPREPGRYADVPPAPPSSDVYVPPYRRDNAAPPLRSEAAPSHYAAPAPAAPRQAMAMRTPTSMAPAVPPAAPAVPPSPARTPVADAATGNVIEVQSGDTLMSLSKRHRVSMSELMSINGLSSPTLRPGQKLALPAGRRVAMRRGHQNEPQVASAAAGSRPTAEPEAIVRPSPVVATPGRGRVQAAQPLSAGGDWTGTHTLARGESLYGIARRYNVKLADLQSANGISDPTKLRPGLELKVPGGRDATAMAMPAPAAPIAESQSGGSASPQPRIINGAGATNEARHAAVTGPSRTDASPIVPPLAAPVEPASAAGAAAPGKLGNAVKFRWPVKGRVLAGFGPGASGHNDGINIAVPVGTDVTAADGGVVTYAGNELKGYGNLILVRHDDNWVSAYAHNDRLLVREGEKVRRGQAIAKAGTSGTNQPQLHFELRQGSKPVDPLPYMERN